jgi:hypothetical protein
LTVRGGFHPPTLEGAIEFVQLPFAIMALRWASIPIAASRPREIATSFGVNVCR